MDVAAHVTEYWAAKHNAEPLWDTWQAPHRATLPMAVSGLQAKSLYEIGCGPGANLRLLQRECPGVRLGGSDVNEWYVKWAQERLHVPIEHKTLPHGVGPEWDVTLTCFTLSYLDLEDTLETLTRVQTRSLILMEPWGDVETWYSVDQTVALRNHPWLALAERTGWFLTWRWPVPEVNGLDSLAIFQRRERASGPER